jgi:hypothetical protein
LLEVTNLQKRPLGLVPVTAKHPGFLTRGQPTGNVGISDVSLQWEAFGAQHSRVGMKSSVVVNHHDQPHEKPFRVNVEFIDSERIRPISKESRWHGRSRLDGRRDGNSQLVGKAVDDFNQRPNIGIGLGKLPVIV